MPITEVSICNSALSHLGQAPIATLDELTKAAKACKQRYEQIKDMVTYEHPWNFAIGRVALSLRVDKPAFDYEYWFDLPADYLRVLNTDVNDDYVIESRKLLTNDADVVNIKYLRTVTDTGYFTPSFAEAVALRLASDLAYNLTQSASKGQELLARYMEHLRTCRTYDAQEGTPEELESNEFLDAHIFRRDL